MTREHLITVPVGTTLDAARKILHQHKVEKLLVVDRDFRLKGLISVKDIQKAVKTRTRRRTRSAGCAAAPRWAWRATRWSGPPRWSPPTSTCSSSTPPTGIPRACWTWSIACPVPKGATGNIATEDLVSMLHEMGIETGIDLESLLSCARRAQEVLGRPLSGHLLTAGPVDWHSGGGKQPSEAPACEQRITGYVAASMAKGRRDK